MSMCRFEDCIRPSHCKGLCEPHYRQQLRGEELRPLHRDFSPVVYPPGKIEGCLEMSYRKKLRLCSAHYYQYRRGTLEGPGPRSCENCEREFVPLKLRTARCCSQKCNRAICRLRTRHNTTPTYINALLRQQDFQCAICHCAMDRISAHIDHDHRCCSDRISCGECIRGLLCPLCNRGLGIFKDSTGNLTSAVEYLNRYEVSLHA